MEQRSIHLGVDFWVPAKTQVSVLCDGIVVAATNATGEQNYGGLLIVKHDAVGFEFFTLYGHLDPSSISKY